MSITEEAAIKAVRDGLEGRNVPIVHEEIRVVLAMALERDALCTRAETAERDLNLARGLISRLGDLDALGSLDALLRRERARVAELEREVSVLAADCHDATCMACPKCCDRLERECADLSRTLEYRDDSRKHLKERAERAEADAARLREALERYGQHTRECNRVNVYDVRCVCGFDVARSATTSAAGTSACPVCGISEPHSAESLKAQMRSLERDVEAYTANHDGGMLRAVEGDLTRIERAVKAHAALASAPSAEPTPREMTDCMMTHHPSQPCTSCEARRRAEKDLASAPSAEPEGPDYSGLCSAPECGGHCGYVHAVGCEAIREYLAEHGGDAYKAPARTAHLAPSAEPTPRDMRVAEAVHRQHLRIVDEWFASAAPNSSPAHRLGRIDLAAVVAKAVGT